MNLTGLIQRELSEGHNEQELADAIGVSRNTIKRILVGSYPKSPEIWKRFAAYFRMDLDLLRFGNLKSAIPHSQLFSKDPVTRVAQYRKVPLLSWSRVGRVRKHGLPQGEVDAEAMLETDVHGPHVFALRVRDDSMEPLFRKGEVIFVNPDLQPAHDHYVIVASGLKDGGEGKIRQLKKLGNQAFLHALNPKYADVPVTGHRIVGRVVRLRMNL